MYFTNKSQNIVHSDESKYVLCTDLIYQIRTQYIVAVQYLYKPGVQNNISIVFCAVTVVVIIV